MKVARSLAVALVVACGVAEAGPIRTEVVTPVADSVGGYDMVGFLAPTVDPALSATSIDGDVVMFTGKNGATLPAGAMQVSNASWWSGAQSPFYKAPVSGSGAVNWLELIMPADTHAFSLTIDASSNVNAWILGIDSSDPGQAIDTAGNTFTLDGTTGNFTPTPAFNIQLRNGASQSFGFYTDNSDGACNTISKVVIDPTYWGMGDFSINVDPTRCGTVPTPAPATIFGLALLGLACTRYLRRAPVRRPA